MNRDLISLNIENTQKRLIDKIRQDMIKMFDNKEIVELDNDMQTIDNNINDYFDNLINNLKLQDIK